MTRAIVILALAATAATGCADPYKQAPELNEAAVPGEVTAPPVRQPHHRPARVFDSPEDAARSAAELTGTWTGPTAARRQAELARETVGQARREAQRSAAQLPTDPQITAPGDRSTATVEAVVRRGGDPTRLIVLTRVTMHVDGMKERRWRIHLATAERRGDGWALSRWEPQP